MPKTDDDLFYSKSQILERKAEGRRKLAGLTLGEKIARMEKLRERVAPLKAARERHAAQNEAKQEQIMDPGPPIR